MFAYRVRLSCTPASNRLSARFPGRFFAILKTKMFACFVRLRTSQHQPYLLVPRTDVAAVANQPLGRPLEGLLLRSGFG